MKPKKFSPFDLCKSEKPPLPKSKRSHTLTQLKHLYEAALENDKKLKAEIKNGDFEKF